MYTTHRGHKKRHPWKNLPDSQAKISPTENGITREVGKVPDKPVLWVRAKLVIGRDSGFGNLVSRVVSANYSRENKTGQSEGEDEAGKIACEAKTNRLLQDERSGCAVATYPTHPPCNAGPRRSIPGMPRKSLSSATPSSARTAHT
jgi:hypothetical protein